MDKEKLKKSIKELGPWYHNVNIHGIQTVSKGQPYSAQIPVNSLWKKIKKFLPKTMKGLRILDVGCNSGFYSLNMALLGAEVIGIEFNKTFFNQAVFLKKHFEEINKKVNVTYIKDDVSNVNFKKMKKFDYIFALAIIYHIGKNKYGKYTDKCMAEQFRVLKILSGKTDNFIVGTRNSKKNNVEHYNKVFNKLGFKAVDIISGGKRSWVLYRKGVNNVG